MLRIDEKKKIVAELETKLKSSRAAIFADYRGLNVAEADELRRAFREGGSEIRVIKNTLMRRAARQSGFEEIEQFLTGPTAVALNFEDPVVPAKLLMGFAKKNRNLKIKGGVIEGKVVGVKEIKYLADLPGREVLIAQVMGGFTGPLAGLSFALQGFLRKLVYALRAVQEKNVAG